MWSAGNKISKDPPGNAWICLYPMCIGVYTHDKEFI